MWLCKKRTWRFARVARRRRSLLVVTHAQADHDGAPQRIAHAVAPVIRMAAEARRRGISVATPGGGQSLREGRTE